MRGTLNLSSLSFSFSLIFFFFFQARLFLSIPSDDEPTPRRLIAPHLLERKECDVGLSHPATSPTHLRTNGDPAMPPRVH